MTRATDETLIRDLLAVKTDAVRRKDAPAALACYADDLVRYDLAPPLATRGAEALDPAGLNAWFDTWRGPIVSELRDLRIELAGDLACAHGLARLGGTKTTGEVVDIWVRETVCLRKRADAWTIVHEHVSTPFYMDGSLKAAVDLQP